MTFHFINTKNEHKRKGAKNCLNCGKAKDEGPWEMLEREK